MVGFPFRSAGVIVCIAPSAKRCSLKSGACSPTVTALPAKVKGFPLNVTAPARDKAQLLYPPPRPITPIEEFSHVPSRSRKHPKKTPEFFREVPHGWRGGPRF